MHIHAGITSRSDAVTDDEVLKFKEDYFGSSSEVQIEDGKHSLAESTLSVYHPLSMYFQVQSLDCHLRILVR